MFGVQRDRCQWQISFFCLLCVHLLKPNSIIAFDSFWFYHRFSIIDKSLLTFLSQASTKAKHETVCSFTPLTWIALEISFLLYVLFFSLLQFKWCCMSHRDLFRWNTWLRFQLSDDTTMMFIQVFFFFSFFYRKSHWMTWSDQFFASSDEIAFVASWKQFKFEKDYKV